MEGYTKLEKGCIRLTETNKEYLDFYNKIIGFDRFIEIRNFYKSGAITSRYFKDASSIIKYIALNRNTVNLYSGVNPRIEEGRKLQSISYLRNIVFDIESRTTKTPLLENNTETVYMKKLKSTVNFLQEYLKNEYDLDVSCVVISGRGLHCYVTLNDHLNINDYKIKYKNWYKHIMKHINSHSPYFKEIKCDEMVYDFSRILGAPGSIHTKYPEKPIRKIIYINTNTNNTIKKTLDKYGEIKYPKPKRNHSKKGIKSIFDTPEFKVFEHHPIQGTRINNRLRLALRLLMVKEKMNNFDEVSQRISELGYPFKDMRFEENEYPDYEYSESILNNYVIDNYKWSVQNGFKLPYELKEEKRIKRLKYMIEEIDTSIDHVEMNEITNMQELLHEISEFNKKFKNNKNNKVIYYTKLLERSILNSIKDEYFKQFITYNNLIERLKFYEEI